MVYELMRVTLVLCVVVGPLLFLSQIFLTRIRRNSERRLSDIQVDLSLQIDRLAGARAPVQRETAQTAPQSDGVSGADFFLARMNSALK